MPKRNGRTTQQVQDEHRAAAVSPTAFVARDKDGNFIDVFDYGEFAGVGTSDLTPGKMRLTMVDPKALALALSSDPLRSLPGSADILRQGRGDNWFRALRTFIRRNGLSELPGVTIRYE